MSKYDALANLGKVTGILLIHPEGLDVKVLEYLGAKNPVQALWEVDGISELEELMGGKVVEVDSDENGFVYFEVYKNDPGYEENKYKTFVMKKQITSLTMEEWDRYTKAL